MEFATLSDEKEIIDLYKAVIEKVNLTEVRLGWNIDIYPNSTFIESAILHGELCVIREEGKIVAVAVINHSMNTENKRTK